MMSSTDSSCISSPLTLSVMRSRRGSATNSRGTRYGPVGKKVGRDFDIKKSVIGNFGRFMTSRVLMSLQIV